ncbi:hypothetical protein BJY59DRAFT_296064 [Rhodotorula toruloides]
MQRLEAPSPLQPAGGPTEQAERSPSASSGAARKRRESLMKRLGSRFEVEKARGRRDAGGPGVALRVLIVSVGCASRRSSARPSKTRRMPWSRRARLRSADGLDRLATSTRWREQRASGRRQALQDSSILCRALRARGRDCKSSRGMKRSGRGGRGENRGLQLQRVSRPSHDSSKQETCDGGIANRGKG